MSRPAWGAARRGGWARARRVSGAAGEMTSFEGNWAGGREGGGQAWQGGKRDDKRRNAEAIWHHLYFFSFPSAAP